ncbi:unnamed protein product [Closterium sp. Naga37s-1]|nr:unnamed protein product [Closterium sp. Naga37s-1]
MARRSLTAVYGDETAPPASADDPACAALGCEPGGTCEVDENGERYCKWDSPCGTCPTGATCKTVPAYSNNSVQVPYCECPAGYGMTSTECVLGGSSTVSSFSLTLFANPAAKDNTSRPYTIRLNPTGCTQYPPAVAGKSTFFYGVANIGSTWSCPYYYTYSTDNCEGRVTGHTWRRDGFFAFFLA